MTILDYSIETNYTKRQMFLDGGVSIQRFDEFAYKKLSDYEKIQFGAFWGPEEVTLTKDKIDFNEASDTVRHVFTTNLLRQTTIDSVQARSPIQIFSPVASVPELESLVQWWSAFENIHSKSYSHIIRNIYNVPSDQFNKIHHMPEITNMVAGINRYYEDLHLLNCKVALGEYVSEHAHVKAIWLALITSYGLEAIRFMVSFITSLVMVENKIFIGNGNIISLILQDELLHADWTAYIINQVVKDDPRFKQVKHELQHEAQALLQAVIDEEKAFAGFITKKGPLLGVNHKILVDSVDWTAQHALPRIDMKHSSKIKSSPTPWYNKHLNTNKKQSALQETENVAYLIGAVTSEINYDELPEI